MTGPAAALPPQGQLVRNIIYFCRALRRAGLAVGPAQAKDAVRAVQAVGFTSRMDFFYTLRSCLVTRAEHLDVFSQVFAMFWRDPEFLEHMVSMMLPSLNAPPDEKDPKAAEKRAAEAMMDGMGEAPPVQEREELELDAQFSVSNREKLQSMDFEQMSAAEIRDAERAIAALDLGVPPLQSRRTQRDDRGRIIDGRATLQKALRRGGEVIELPKRKRRTRQPDLVVLCDISGSMSVYSRMLMHFLHSVSRARGAGWARVHGFTFGTRLTNITRSLSERDPDAALRAIGQQADDWDGGTRIGEALHRFNLDWSRRVLGQGATVLLITDGLERSDLAELEAEAKRLRRSARRIIWLNPLMRWDGFTPQAAGIRTLLPLVDSFHACHSIDSLQELSEVLQNPGSYGTVSQKQRLMSLL